LLERLIFEGPVASNLSVDMPELLRDGLAGWAAGGHAGGAAGGRMGTEVDLASGPRDWERVPLIVHKSGMFYDVDTHSGAGLPDSLAYCLVTPGECHSGDAELLDRIDRVLHPLAVVDLELRLYDFGIVMLRIVAAAAGEGATHGAPADGGEQGIVLTAAEAIRWAEQRSSDVCGDDVGLREWCDASIHRLGRSIPAAPLPDDDSPNRSEGLWKRPRQGQVQWLHRIPVLRRHADRTGESLCSTVEAVLGIDCAERIDYQNSDLQMTVVPGDGTSVIAVDDGPADLVAAVVAQFAAIIALQTAYWAAGQELSTAILKSSIDFALISRHPRLPSAREAGYRLVSLSQDFSLFQGLLSQRLLNLAPSDTTFWEHIARAWGLQWFLEQMDKRLDDFGTLGDRFLRKMQDDAASRLNTVVIILTVVSGVSTAASLIVFAQERNLAHPVAWNVTLLVLAAVAITAFVAAVTRLPARKHRQRGDNPSP
jgi:hypothetical protein